MHACTVEVCEFIFHGLLFCYTVAAVILASATLPAVSTLFVTVTLENVNAKIS